jgi:hypothetical protein
MASLAAQLTEKFAEQANELPRRYEAAIRECDDAWDGVLGALDSGFITLAIDAMKEFRAAYARKLSLHRQVLNAH